MAKNPLCLKNILLKISDKHTHAIAWKQAMLVVLFLCGCSGHEPRETTSVRNNDFSGGYDVRRPTRPPDGFQGLLLSAPDTVFVSPIEVGRPTREDGVSGSRADSYEGELILKGTFSVFVPDGDQEKIWSDLSNKIDFVVRDLKTGQIQRRRRVDGGWNIAGMGISIVMAQIEPLPLTTQPCRAIQLTFNASL